MKDSYKIPASLDASYGDMEIAIQSKDGIGVRPLPIKVILTYVGSALLCMYLCMHTFIAKGSFIQLALFVVGWIVMTIQLAAFDSTKAMRVQLIPTLLAYIPKRNRVIIMRQRNDATPFAVISGNPKRADNGVITYDDNTFGLWYRVVGSASVLLFEDDRELIIDRVQSFFEKNDCDVEFIFVTTKEAQQTYRQIANLKRNVDKLTTNDAELLAMANEEYHTLKRSVTYHKSIHQYMMIKADNMEALIKANNILQSEIDNSTLMFKQCNALDEEDYEALMSNIYRRGEHDG